MRISWAALLLLLATACTDQPRRPAQLPEEAVFSGGPKHGYWLLCNPAENNLLSCDLFHLNGDPYQSGTFEYLSELPDCFPGFVLSDYRYSDGFLAPRLVKFASDTMVLVGFEAPESLEERISDAYVEVFNVRPEGVSIELRDSCGNGTYLAALAPPTPGLSGRIWAGRIIQVLDPSRPIPTDDVPIVIP